MSDFSAIINRNKPVLVDFYADWCQPCKMMNPILKDLKDELGEDITILKINVDKNKQISSKYKIQGVPTFIIFKKGKILWRKSGLVYKKDFISVINQYK